MQQSIRKFPFLDFQEPVKQAEKIDKKQDIKHEKENELFDVNNTYKANNYIDNTEQIVKKQEDKKEEQFKKYLPEEIITIKKEEYKKGWEEASKKHLDSIKAKHNQQEANLNDEEANLMDTVQKIQQELQNLSKKIALSNQVLIRDCADLCYEMAKKVIHKSTRACSKEMLIDFFNQNLPLVSNISNDIKVMINKSDYEKLKLYIHKNKNMLGSGITFLADKYVKPGDCLIKWQNGSIEKNKDHILKEFESLLVNYFSDTNNQC